MKLSIISLLAVLAATTAAVDVTFIGDPSAPIFAKQIPTDGKKVSINDSFKVIKIQSHGGGDCTFTGVDGSVTKVTGTKSVKVAKPQPQISGSCVAA